MRAVRLLTVAWFLSALLGCSQTQSTLPPKASPPPLGLPGQKIAHIVFVIQENRTFDNVFGGPHPFPGADAATTGKTSTGMQPLQEVKLECTYSVRLYLCPRQDPDNYHPQWLQACDPASPSKPPFTVGDPSPCQMDHFDKNQTGDLDPGQIYSYVDYAETKPYWDIAKAYAMSDRFFMGHNSESYTAHQYLFSGQSKNVVDGPVYPLPTPAPQNVFITPWGCDSPRGTKTFVLNPVTGEESAQPTGPLPCFGNEIPPYLSVADLINRKPPLSWRLYAYSICQNINALDVDLSIRNSSIWPKDVENKCPNATAVKTNNFRIPEDSFLQDLANTSDNLASVTWVLPGAITSDHPGVPYGYCGPWWAASIVDAIGKSRYWSSTVVFILWDDWGGFYDHVAPYVVRDQAGPGFRVPLLVVSPYAKRGVVVSTNTEFGTLLKFVETTFGLGSLGATDRSPYLNDLSGFFDFSNPQPFVPINIPGYTLCNDGFARAHTHGARSRWLRMIDHR
jgi:phospholipase C